MRGRIPIAVLAVLATVAVVVVIAGAGGGAGGLDPVARAAQTTVQVGGAHMSIAGSITVPGLSAPITMHGQGAFNFRAKEGELSLSVTGVPAQAGASSITMTELFKSDSVYVGSPLFAGKLPGGARWVRLDLGRVQQAIGVDPGSLTNGSTNPAALLEDLKHAGGARMVGHETVRGVATTHYAGTLDLLSAAEQQAGSKRAQLRGALKLFAASGLDRLPIGVWIDARGRVRRITMELSLNLVGQQVSATIQCEFFGFGATPSISAPSGSEVFDATGQTLAPLTAGG